MDLEKIKSKQGIPNPKQAKKKKKRFTGLLIPSLEGGGNGKRIESY